ncbi:hypothetical protein Tco_0014398 [Tanacetum coccineum]
MLRRLKKSLFLLAERMLARTLMDITELTHHKVEVVTLELHESSIFTIDLMPVPLGVYDVIYVGIGLDLTRAQKYLSTGCDIVLAHITTKEAKDKSAGKRLKDVPIVKDFPDVFPEDLSDIPPARQIVKAFQVENPSKDESILKIEASPNSPDGYTPNFQDSPDNVQKFIECFSKIAKSMTKLTQKNGKFDWEKRRKLHSS